MRRRADSPIHCGARKKKPAGRLRRPVKGHLHRSLHSPNARVTTWGSAVPFARSTPAIASFKSLTSRNCLTASIHIRNCAKEGLLVSRFSQISGRAVICSLATDTHLVAGDMERSACAESADASSSNGPAFPAWVVMLSPAFFARQNMSGPGSMAFRKDGSEISYECSRSCS